MKKNPFERLINHKILHKVGKQWVVLSAGLLFLLSDAAIATHVNASQINQTQPNQSLHITKSTQQQSKITNSHQAKSLINFTKSHKLQHTKNASTQVKTVTDHNRLPINNTKAIHNKAKTLYQSIIRKTARTNRVVINHKNGKRIFTARRRYRRHHVTKKHSISNKEYYINTNRKDEQYGIPYGQLGYFQKDNSDEYSNIFSDLGYIYKGHKSKIYNKARVRGYNFDLVRVPDEIHSKYWLMSDMLSNRKNRYYSPYAFPRFINKEDKSFLNRHFDSSDINDINSVEKRYNYLKKHEDQSSTRATYSFRHHVIDWINFYRQTLFHESPVSENTSFDRRAQYGANHQKDQEDMNWGSSDPSGILYSYITDSADMDNDGQTGHRDSVLDSKSAQVGVGQKGDVNALFFHWGWGNTATNPYYNIDCPKLNDSPIDLAKNGEYWSIKCSSDLNSVHFHITDETTHKTLPIQSTHLVGSESYLKINPSKLHTGHIYKINENYTYGNDDETGNYHYTTQFYNIDPMNEP